MYATYQLLGAPKTSTEVVFFRIDTLVLFGRVHKIYHKSWRDVFGQKLMELRFTPKKLRFHKSNGMIFAPGQIICDGPGDGIDISPP